MNEQIIPLMKDECPINVSTRSYNCYDIILDEDIKPPYYYRNAFQALREAQEGDVVRIFICTSGGSLSSAIQFKNYIDECQGHVIAIVDGEAYSAGSLIALCAHEIHVKPFSTWMLHSASFGVIGNTENVKAQVDFTVKHADAFMEEVYRDFVTPEELSDIRRGVEIWLDADQVNERLERKFAKMQDDYGTAQGEVQTLDEIVENAVESVLNRVLDQREVKEKKAMQKAQKKPSVKTAKALEGAKEIKEMLKED